MPPHILFEENLFSSLLTYLYLNDFKSRPGCPQEHKAPVCLGDVILQHSKLSTSTRQPLTSSQLLSRTPLLWKSASASAVPSLLRCQILLVLPFASVPFAFHCYHPFWSPPPPFSLVAWGSLLTGLPVSGFCSAFSPISPRAHS